MRKGRATASSTMASNEARTCCRTANSAASMLPRKSMKSPDLFALFGGGAASYISRLLGAGKRGEANECASTSLATSMAVAILLLAGFVAFAEPFLRRS